MIKVISKAFNEKAHDDINIPDISHPLILHKVEPDAIDYELQPELRNLSGDRRQGVQVPRHLFPRNGNDGDHKRRRRQTANRGNRG